MDLHLRDKPVWGLWNRSFAVFHNGCVGILALEQHPVRDASPTTRIHIARRAQLPQIQRLKTIVV